MRYSKYFKPEQKVLMRSLAADDTGRIEALTAYFHEGGPDHIDLTLPYRARGEEMRSIPPDAPFEILTDAFGVGIRITGSFHEWRGEDQVRLRINDDLQVFQRRLADRLDITVALGYTKGRGTLRTFQERWEKNVQILSASGGAAKLPPLPRVKVNLSRGGVRFRLKPPVATADLCLLLLQLDDGAPPVCALAEVVWLDEQPSDGLHTTGMQFLNIMEKDQKRIEAFLKKAAPSR